MKENRAGERSTLAAVMVGTSVSHYRILDTILNRPHRIAVICGATPLLLETAIFVTWLVARWNWLIIAGAIMLCCTGLRPKRFSNPCSVRLQADLAQSGESRTLRATLR